MRIRYLLYIFTLFIFVGLIPAVLFFGYRLGTEVEAVQRSTLYYKLKRADEILYGLKNRFFPQKDDGNVIEVENSILDTNLLRVSFSKQKVSDARTPYDGLYDNSGGALTLVNGNILLLDSKGRFYYGQSFEQGFVKLNFIAPPTNQEHYEALMDDPEYANASFRKTPFKYNDIQYFESGVKHGLLLSYTQFEESGACYRNILGIIDADTSQPITELTVSALDWRTIYRSKPCLPLIKSGAYAVAGESAGGKIEFIAPSTVYMANGDFDNFDVAQNDEADYGKMLSIDILTGESHVISKGLRNPKGLFFDAKGQFLEVEMGPRGGDELNIIVAGENYGWPIESFGTTYTGTPNPFSSSFGRHDQYKRPLFSWTPSIAPSGIIELTDFHEFWNGDLIISSLIARSLYRVRIIEDQVAYIEPIFVGERIRDILQFGQKLVLLTDDMELVFITVDKIPVYDDLLDRFLKKNEKNINPNKLKANIKVCQQCHDWFGNDNSKAPNLQNVYGDIAGTTAYQGYTPAMKNLNKQWDEDLLKSFLLQPQAVVPGTAMPNPGISDQKEIEDIIELLKYVDKIH